MNDGQSRVEGRPDCVLVVLREDDDQGLLTAITERPPSKQRTKEIIAGCQLQPASGGRQFDSRSSVYFNIVKCLQLHDGELRFKSGMKAKLWPNISLHTSRVFLIFILCRKLFVTQTWLVSIIIMGATLLDWSGGRGGCLRQRCHHGESDHSSSYQWSEDSQHFPYLDDGAHGRLPRAVIWSS